jgi:hypothetical protein
MHTQPLIHLHQSGLAEKIGVENLAPHFDAGLKRAEAVAGGPENR